MTIISSLFSSSFINLLVTGIFVWLVFIWIKSQWRTSIKLPPGPRPWPVIGNLPDVLKCKSLWEYAERVRQQYGDVFMIYLGTKPTVIISGLKFFHEAYLTKELDFAGRPYLSSGQEVTFGQRTILFARKPNPRWLAQRKLIHSTIRTYMNGESFQNIVDNSFGRFCRLIECKQPLYPLEAVDKLLLNIVYSIMFGKDLEFDDPFLIGCAEARHRRMSANISTYLESMFPFTEYLPYLPGRSSIREGAQYLVRETRKSFAEHLESKTWQNPSDLVDLLISNRRQSMDKATTVELTEEELLAVIIDFDSAAMETNGTVLMWSLLMVTKYPEIQKTIRKELTNILGDDDLQFDDFDKDRFPYLVAVIREAMRRYTVVPLGIVHETTCDTSLGGYDIPAGTATLIHYDSIHMSEVWGDPETFRPERFLDENGQLIQKPSHFVPFSAGRRVCPGEVMGKKIPPYLLAKVIQNYEVVPAAGEPLSTDEDILGGVIRIPKPFNVFFKKLVQDCQIKSMNKTSRGHFISSCISKINHENYS